MKRDEALRRLQDKTPEEPPQTDVPWHYRKTVMDAAKARFIEKNVTRGVTVAAAKNSALVRVILITPDLPKKGYANTADCQAAFESNLDPELVGKEMVDSFMERIEEIKAGGRP